MRNLALIVVSFLAFIPVHGSVDVIDGMDYVAAPTEATPLRQHRVERGKCNKDRCTSRSCDGDYGKCGEKGSCEPRQCVSGTQALCCQPARSSTEGAEQPSSECGNCKRCQSNDSHGSVDVADGKDYVAAPTTATPLRQHLVERARCGEIKCSGIGCQGKISTCGEKGSCGPRQCISGVQACCCRPTRPAFGGTEQASSNFGNCGGCKHCQGHE